MIDLSPDINECDFDDLNKCGAHSQCVNVFGGYSCGCCAGFSKNDKDLCVCKYTTFSN